MVLCSITHGLSAVPSFTVRLDNVLAERLTKLLLLRSARQSRDLHSGCSPRSAHECWGMTVQNMPTTSCGVCYIRHSVEVLRYVRAREQHMPELCRPRGSPCLASRGGGGTDAWLAASCSRSTASQPSRNTDVAASTITDGARPLPYVMRLVSRVVTTHVGMRPCMLIRLEQGVVHCG